MTKVIKLIDHFKSKEEFKLVWNNEFAWYETNPKPEITQISDYYDSNNYISHQKRNHTLKGKVYAVIRDYMLNNKLNWIKKEIGNRGDILDIGCGVGEFLKKAKKNQFEVSGIETNKKARKIALEEDIPVFKKIEEIGERKFDLISLWHVLEHLNDPDKVLQQIKEHLKPNGRVFIAVPNFKSYDAEYYKEYWAAYDVPRHLYHFSRKSIALLAERNGFEVKRTYPLKFDSYYVAMLSEEYKKEKSIINWLLQGWKSNNEARRTGEWSSITYVLKASRS